MARSRLVQGLGNTSYTENMALSHRSTLDSVLDFFSKVGALRGQREEAIRYFRDAYLQDRLLSLKALFYGRDIRGGAGERQTFKDLAAWVARNDSEAMAVNLELVPMYGRWEDLYAFVGTPLQNHALRILTEQLSRDYALLQELGDEANVTLAGKWAKSANTSSDESRALGRLTAKYMGLTERQYRKMLSALRKQANVVERFMSARDWGDIEYSSVPSKAMTTYRDAFMRHDEVGFTKYLEALERGDEDVSINAATLFPYELTRKYLRFFSHYGNGIHLAAYDIEDSLDRVVEAQWKALPNEITQDFNMLPLIDTSGSMFLYDQLPISIATSLGIYLAERNQGQFHNTWINFSESPTLQELKGDTLLEKLNSLDWSNWAMNTNIQRVFDLILDTAKRYRVPESEMPDVLVVVSDMQFDSAERGNKRTNFEVLRQKYSDAEYELPVMVWWNVRAGQDTPVVFDETGNALVSGASPSVFKAMMRGDLETLRTMTPLSNMLDTLNNERYSKVKLPE